MTLGTTISTITVQGNGLTSTFAYPFIIPAASDAVVTYTNMAGTPTVLLPTQFVITGLGQPDGGTVSYPMTGPAIPTGSSLTIARILPLVQTTSIASQGPTFAAIEGEFDYQMECIQQIESELALSGITNAELIAATASFTPAVGTFLPLSGGTVTGSTTFSGALTQISGQAWVGKASGGQPDLIIGPAALSSTTASGGNLLIPFTNGAPVGIPAQSAKGVSIKWDQAGHQLWAFDPVLNNWVATTGSTASTSTAWITPQQYGAVADGSTDCTSAITAMIAATAAGQMVFWQAGVYKITSVITVGTSSTWIGAGRLASTILVSNTNCAAFIFNAAVNISDMGFEGLGGGILTNSTMLTYNSGAIRSRLDRFWMISFYSGIESSCDDITFTDGQMFNWQTLGSGMVLSDGISVLLQNITMQQGAAPGTGNGIVIFNGGPTITDCQILACGNALYIGPGEGQAANSIWVMNSGFDSSVNSLVVAPTGNGGVERSWFIGCWFGGASQNGIQISSPGGSGQVNGLDFVNCHILGNSSFGVTITDANSLNLNFTGCKIAGNHQYGISMFAGLHQFTIKDCIIGPYGGFSDNFVGGINMGGASTFYQIVGNNLISQTQPLVGAGVQTGGTPGVSEIITNNTGYFDHNRGQATINTSLTSVLVAHGLGGTPRLQDILLTGLTGMGNPPMAIPFVLSPNASNFTIEIGIPLGFATGFTWYARLPCTP